MWLMDVASIFCQINSSSGSSVPLNFCLFIYSFIYLFIIYLFIYSYTYTFFGGVGGGGIVLHAICCFHWSFEIKHERA